VGAWGKRAFDNDEANDWAAGLADVDDLSLVESTFSELENMSAAYVNAHVACNALAACEVLARLQGNFGYRNAYTEKVDEWVAAHPIRLSPVLLRRAHAAIERILGGDSELRELWEAGDGGAWRQTVEDLRRRVSA
jgi:hypothetical protein